MEFGILRLRSNKTFGRQIKKNGKEGKPYYGVSPAIKTDIPLKVPYEPKFVGSSRIQSDRYICYKVNKQDKWERPIGQIIENFGPVESVQAYETYKILKSGMTPHPRVGKYLTNIVTQAKSKANSYFPKLKTKIITIDPEGCLDMDDGFGIEDLGNNTYRITICITHVPANLLNTTIDIEHLSDLLINPCSIYLPDRTVHMFTSNFSLPLLSLYEGNEHAVLSLHIDCKNDGTIIQTMFDINTILVCKNFTYDSVELKNNKIYQDLFKVCTNVCNKNPLQGINNITDSHDLVAYLMIIMNSTTAKFLSDSKQSVIFRNLNKREDVIVPQDYSEIKNILSFRAGTYSTIPVDPSNLYCHVTSPMRRIVDIVNMVQVSELIGWQKATRFSRFCEQVISKINKVCEQCRKARRIGLDSQLLYSISSGELDICKPFDVIIVGKESSNEYVVYIEDLKRIMRLKSELYLDLFSRKSCKILYFDKEDNETRKIRITLIK